MNNCIIFEDIIDYKYNFSTIDIITTKFDNKKYDISKYNKSKSYYFILDSGVSKEFGYWIFESYIFIDLLKKLNEIHSNIIILTKVNYDIKPLLSLFNINNSIVNNIDNYNNICYSPQIYSIYYIHRLNNDNYYNYHLLNYINTIKNTLDITVKRYNYVFINNEVKESIIKNDGIITNDLYNLSILNNTNRIILYYNPLFYYYCIFLENKNIIIIEDDFYEANRFGTHYGANPFLHYLISIIISRNKVKIINSKQLHEFL